MVLFNVIMIGCWKYGSEYLVYHSYISFLRKWFLFIGNVSRAFFFPPDLATLTLSCDVMRQSNNKVSINYDNNFINLQKKFNIYQKLLMQLLFFAWTFQLEGQTKFRVYQKFVHPTEEENALRCRKVTLLLFLTRSIHAFSASKPRQENTNVSLTEIKHSCRHASNILNTLTHRHKTSVTTQTCPSYLSPSFVVIYSLLWWRIQYSSDFLLERTDNSEFVSRVSE